LINKLINYKYLKMKKKKMYLLFACLVSMTVACKKNDSLPDDAANQDVVSSGSSARLGTNESDIIEKSTVDPDNFIQGVNNPFFPLNPGDTYHYLASFVNDGITVNHNGDFMITDETKLIQGVTCMIVHDVTTGTDGTLIEDTYDWFAQDIYGNVWYFGEDTKKYDENGNFSTAGSWEAGVDGAMAGIQMWAHPRAHIGQIYNQEFYSGIAEDKAKVIDGNVFANVPFGSLQNCVRIKEFTPLEPGINGYKQYKEGIGQVSSATPIEGERAVLISITH
jgi:hypothetical protein